MVHDGIKYFPPHAVSHDVCLSYHDIDFAARPEALAVV